MDYVQKKRRDTTRHTAERGTAQALKAIAPAISNCNSRLAHCRAVASLSKPGYTNDILAECQSLRGEVLRLRGWLQQIIAALARDQHGNSRIRDTRHALDNIDVGIEGVLETVAANGNSSPAEPCAGGMNCLTARVARLLEDEALVAMDAKP
jgi:hypothetical protein